MPPHATVTLRFTQAILQAAERMQVPIPERLRNAIPAGDRVPMAVQDELWETFCAAVDDPLIGVRLGLALQVGHLDLVGMLLMSCETQGEALDLLLEYHPIVGEGGDFEVAHHGSRCLLIYEPHYRVRRRERVEAVMAAVLNLTRWITGDQFQVDAVHFSHAAAAPTADYQALLDAPIVFDAPENALVYAPALQATPLIQANTAMRDHLKQLADRALTELATDSTSRQVQALIRRYPRWGKERVADELGMSGRHLVRKLQEEGTSFKLLRTSLLQQLAEEALGQGEPVTRVAEQLGFSDESAFNKAFKRWAGTTPARFRKSV
jgi:AraC-like DNA-binding protein